MIRQARRDIGFDPPRRRERGERVDRRGNAQRRVASAIDELMDLREKLDLANAAAPALQVEARAERLPLREMVANTVEIGRASCRARRCQYVSTSVVAGSLKTQSRHRTKNAVIAKEKRKNKWH